MVPSQTRTAASQLRDGVLDYLARFPGASAIDVRYDVVGDANRKTRLLRDLIASGVIENRPLGRQHRYYLIRKAAHARSR